MRIAIIAMLMAAQSAPVLSEPSDLKTGNDFLGLCDSLERGGQSELACVAYVRGVTDGIRAASPSPMMCLPAGVDIDQLMAIGIKKIKENPEIAHNSPSLLLYGAWAVTFPCAKPPQRK